MQVPLEITYRDVQKSEALEELIYRKIDKLERVCDYLISCRLALEKTQKQMRSGDVFRVRVNLTVPPGHEIVVSRESVEGEIQNTLPSLIRQAFDVGFRELKQLVQKQRGEVKTHPEQQVQGTIIKIFREAGYGFISSREGHELYFHKNSVLGRDFERLEIGTGVHYVEGQGEEGPQASSVRILDRPGAGIAGAIGIEPS